MVRKAGGGEYSFDVLGLLQAIHQGVCASEEVLLKNPCVVLQGNEHEVVVGAEVLSEIEIEITFGIALGKELLKIIVKPQLADQPKGDQGKAADGDQDSKADFPYVHLHVQQRLSKLVLDEVKLSGMCHISSKYLRPEGKRKARHYWRTFQRLQQA